MDCSLCGRASALERKERIRTPPVQPLFEGAIMLEKIRTAAAVFGAFAQALALYLLLHRH